MAYPGQYGYGGGVPPAGGAFGAAPSYGAQPYGAYPGQQPYHGGPAPYGQVPSIDPQVQQWFMSVDQDKSGRITALELQKALINTNWTPFNEETCRLMIGMFDKDFSGTIDLFEFQALWHYIQQWRATFDSFDMNKSGSIESHELHQAYQRMGYNVSQQFVQTVVVKFDHYGRRTLTLDNFIQSCVMLKQLTDAFRQRDATMTGVVRLSYEDFMQLAILNKP